MIKHSYVWLCLFVVKKKCTIQVNLNSDHLAFIFPPRLIGNQNRYKSSMTTNFRDAEGNKKFSQRKLVFTNGAQRCVVFFLFFLNLAKQ